MRQEFDDMTRFKKILNEGGQGRAGWDEPSDGVWLGVEEFLKQKHRRRGLIWYWIIGMIILGLAAFTFGQRQNTDTPEASTQSGDKDVIQQDMNMLPDPALRDQTTAPLSTGGGGLDNPTPVIHDAGTATPALRTEVSRQPDTRLDVVNVDVSRDRSYAENLEDRSGAALAIARSDQPSGMQAEKDLEEQDTVHNTAGAKLQPQSGEQAIALARRSDILVSDIGSVMHTLDDVSRELVEGKVQPSEPDKRSRWVAGVFFGPTLGTRHIAVANNQTNIAKVLLRQQETPVVRASLGLNVAYLAHSRWDLGIGLECTDYHLKSEYLKQVRYSRAGETATDRGSYESSYRVSINTSYGRVETDVVVEREEDATIPENTFINLQFLMDQSLKFLRIPLFARYHFRLGKTHLYSQVGITLQHLSRSHLEFRAIQSMNNEVRQVHTLHTGTLRGTNATTFGYQIGLGVQFQLGTRLSLTAIPTINGGFDPVYERETIKIYPYTFDMRIGVLFNL